MAFPSLYSRLSFYGLGMSVLILKKYLNTLEVGSIFPQIITESLNIFNFIV